MADVVPCGGPKKSPHTSFIVQIIVYFWSFKISRIIMKIRVSFMPRTIYIRQYFVVAFYPSLEMNGSLIDCLETNP